MIIFIFIFVFIIIIALIALVIGYGSSGNGNNKDNKKFTFQYKHNNHNYSSLPPYTPTAHNKQVLYTPMPSNEQSYQNTPMPPNEQWNRYTPMPSNEQRIIYNSTVLNEQENRYTPTAPNEQENRYTPPQPPPKVPMEKVPMEKIPVEKVPISESNQKTECPIVHSVCPSKTWEIPSSLTSYNIDTINCSQIINIAASTEQVSDYLNIPIPKKGEICWSECQNKCIKPECSEMTMETCKTIPYIYSGLPPISTRVYPSDPNEKGMTCEQLSTLTPEFQLQLIESGVGIFNEIVLPGEICWSDVCNKCVKPYVAPPEAPTKAPTQNHLKHNFDPTCFPSKQTCISDNASIGSSWSYAYYTPGDSIYTYTENNVYVPDESCKAWSTFTNWKDYNLNPLVLPGEICYNPCTKRCIAPLSY